MSLHVIGAGLPRTGTHSLQQGLETLLGGRCMHMREVPGHPFDLGVWDRALAGEGVDFEAALRGYRASVDWPASAFWREIAAAHPRAVVLLSLRDSPQTWLDSMEATIMPVARPAKEPGRQQRRGLIGLCERFAGPDWDRPENLITAYERHLATIQEMVPAERLVEWRPGDGWAPICSALGMPEPEEPFPWLNRREDW